MRFLLACLLLPGLALAAILPDTIGTFHRATITKPALTDSAIWGEYGLQDSETGTYENGSAKCTVTVWRLQDTTGSLAAFDWQRPAGATPSKRAAFATETPGNLLMVYGNYLLSFTGDQPSPVEVAALTGSLRNVDTATLPILPGYLPSTHLVPNSERYITGPEALRKFVPGIPPSVAAFHFGTEAQTGVFNSPKGDLTLAIFNYPTPQIAREQLVSFQKLPGAMAKRSGPLVAVVLSPADPDLAEQLLSGVRYQAEITRDQYVPTQRDNMGDLLLNICILIGILMVFGLVSGLALGGFRALVRSRHHGEDPDILITLHLE